MKIEDLKLMSSPLTGAVYIGTVSKKDTRVMNASRRQVDNGEFYDCIYNHVAAKTTKKDGNTLSITVDEKTVIEITIYPENM